MRTSAKGWSNADACGEGEGGTKRGLFVDVLYGRPLSLWFNLRGVVRRGRRGTAFPYFLYEILGVQWHNGIMAVSNYVPYSRVSAAPTSSPPLPFYD